MDSIFSKKTFSFLLVSLTLLSLQHLFAQGCDETTFTDFSRLGYAGNPFNENFITKQKGSTIYILKTGNNSQRTLALDELDTLWIYDIITETFSIKRISTNGAKRKLIKYGGKDFYIHDSTLYINNYKGIHIFKETDTSFVYKGFVKPKYSYSYFLGNIGDDIILYEGYNYHPLDQKEKVIISKFSTKSNKIVKSIYPKMLGVELTHSNKRFCTIHNNTILFAQPFSDTICIYNSELERIGNIELKHKVDATIKINYEEYSTDQIQKLLLEDYLYQRNIKIDVFGDTLLVLHKKKFQNFRGSIRFDVYTHKNNTWQLTDTSKFISFTLDSNKKVLPTTTYVPYIIDNNPLIVHNGSMYELINKHVEIKNPITYKEYNYLIDLAFYNNSFKVTLQKQPLECLFKP